MKSAKQQYVVITTTVSQTHVYGPLSTYAEAYEFCTKIKAELEANHPDQVCGAVVRELFPAFDVV